MKSSERICFLQIIFQSNLSLYNRIKSYDIGFSLIIMSKYSLTFNRLTKKSERNLYEIISSQSIQEILLYCFPVFLLINYINLYSSIFIILIFDKYSNFGIKLKINLVKKNKLTKNCQFMLVYLFIALYALLDKSLRFTLYGLKYFNSVTPQ